MTQADAPWVVVCDFDGTISSIDATDTILEAYARGHWRPIEQQWISGEITARECLLRQTERIRTSTAALDSLIDTIEIDPEFPSFARYCAVNDIPVVIVSDGLDYVIGRILANHGLGDIESFANHWIPRGDDTFALSFPFAQTGCPSGTCKCERVRSLSAGGVPPRILFVGDGRSDFCAASQMAEVVAAKSSLLLHFRSRQLPCVPFDTFADVQRILTTLIAGQANLITSQKDAIDACA
ncbi:MAG: MtnX-like HAD-IB family phosphatase [Hyphomicrobiaceae bacterium]